MIGVVSGPAPAFGLDTGAMVFVLIGVSMPVFWTGILLLLVFGGILGWLPLGGILDSGMTSGGSPGCRPGRPAPGTGRLSGARSTHLVLPAMTLGGAAHGDHRPHGPLDDARRAEPRLRANRAREGRRRGRVVGRHALWNALLPVVTLVGLHLGLLLSGAVLTETIFALPGLGRLTITSVLARDYPVVQGVVLIGAVIFVVANLVVDLLYAWLDPRIRYS